MEMDWNNNNRFWNGGVKQIDDFVMLLKKGLNRIAIVWLSLISLLNLAQGLSYFGHYLKKNECLIKLITINNKKYKY